jgi:hypothetical protein
MHLVGQKLCLLCGLQARCSGELLPARHAAPGGTLCGRLRQLQAQVRTFTIPPAILQHDKVSGTRVRWALAHARSTVQMHRPACVAIDSLLCSVGCISRAEW